MVERLPPSAFHLFRRDSTGHHVLAGLARRPTVATKLRFWYQKLPGASLRISLLAVASWKFQLARQVDRT
ncbi:homoserine kinase [Ahrensia sp. R2A130]|nr:homoserine kinase [Ahrensia sp. R2A130]